MSDGDALESVVGKTVATVEQEMQDHPLDGPEQDGTITLTFTDGSRLHVTGYWCNDSTASTEFEIEAPPPVAVEPGDGVRGADPGAARGPGPQAVGQGSPPAPEIGDPLAAVTERGVERMAIHLYVGWGTRPHGPAWASLEADERASWKAAARSLLRVALEADRG